MLGQHTGMVLEEWLGMTQEQIAGLRSDGAV
jgi:crotonobetainyl-CoA:carnitine CoA-transferase CaiB-like acyl-CoA transferase